ncbi:hypothetical protein CARUB_v10007973mg, partial [Capsella rubella]
MAAPTTGTSDKPFTISQIKAYIPIVLDLKKFNYDVWRELFETHCTTFGVLNHIDGTGVSTPDTEQSWKERDGLVKMWIYGTLSESLLDTVMTAKCTARDLWLTVENLFRDNKEARALQCDHELRTASIGDLSVHEYCLKLKTLSDLLANLDSPVSDRVLVMHLLNGLSDKYDNIINVIKHKTPFPTFATARSMLTMEEDRLAKQSKPLPSNNNSSSTPTVLYTASAQQHSQTQNQQGRGYNNRGRGNKHNRGRGRHNNNTSWQHQSYGPPQWPYGPSQWPLPYGFSPFSSPFPMPHAHHRQPAFPPSNGILGPAPQQRSSAEAHMIQSPYPSLQTVSPYLPSEITHAFNPMALQDPNNSS